MSAASADHSNALPVSTCVVVYLALLGLTAVTVGAAFLEVYVWPDILRAVSPIY